MIGVSRGTADAVAMVENIIKVMVLNDMNFILGSASSCWLSGVQLERVLNLREWRMAVGVIQLQSVTVVVSAFMLRLKDSLR